MGKLLANFSILPAYVWGAQKPVQLLKIISYPGEVTLDETPVKQGRQVYATCENLEVWGAESYAAILTKSEFVSRVRKGNFSIKKLSEEMQEDAQKESARGATR